MFTQVHCNVATRFGTYKGVAENVWREFGSWLRSQREAARLSQSGAAQRAEIDRQQWYRIENGLSGTKRETVNPNIVQKLFAHSDMSITNVYLHADQNELAKAVNTLDDNVIQSQTVQ